MDLYYIIILGLAVSIDGFFAGTAYGIKKIDVPVASLLIIGLVTFFCTLCSVCGAFYIGQYIHPLIATYCGAILLILIGATGILKEYFTHGNDPKEPLRKISFSCGQIIISIMCKPENADMDHSKRLNKLEALLLGFALGLDNMVAAFSIALTSPSAIYAPLIMSLIQTVLVALGIFTASRIYNDKWQKKTLYLPGIILISLGLLRFL